MNTNDINELHLILVKRSNDELETMNKLIVEILAVRTKIATEKAKVRGISIMYGV